MLTWKLCSLTIDTMVSLDISGTGTSLHMKRNIRWSTWTCKQGSIRHGCRYVSWDSALLSQPICQLTSINWNSPASVIKQHHSQYIPGLRNWIWWLSAFRRWAEIGFGIVVAWQCRAAPIGVCAGLSLRCLAKWLWLWSGTLTASGHFLGIIHILNIIILVSSSPGSFRFWPSQFSTYSYCKLGIWSVRIAICQPSSRPESTPKPAKTITQTTETKQT